MSDSKIPLSVTLKYCIAICAGVWLLTFLFPVYVGLAALIGVVLCSAIWLINKVRQAFDFASRDLADFVAGKQSPAQKEALQRVRLEAVKCAVSEAKARKTAVSKGLKQPNQSATVRHINERISAMTFEQLQLEAEIGMKRGGQ